MLERTRELQDINTILEEEITERQAVEEALLKNRDELAASEERYRSLFENLLQGFAYCEMIFENGQPQDFIYLAVNNAFERLTGLSDVIGKKVTAVIPGIKKATPELFDVYGRVALTGHPETFEIYFTPLKAWLFISVYSPAKGSFVAIFDDITERKRHENQLKYYADEVAATNVELKSFVNTIAHDFRSPMVNLKGFSTELGHTLAELKQIVHEAEPILPKGVREKVDELLDVEVPDEQQFINSSVDRLSRMVDALLNLSRLGRRELCYKNVDMNKLVNTIMKSQHHQITEKHIQIVVGALPIASTDHLAMEQIIGNLVDNAIKYLDPSRQGKIEVACTENEYEYVVSVKDNGRGIAATDHEKIFDPFRRSGKHDQPGEGLGLSHVRTLIRKLGGKVWCESALGIGTNMSLTIPKKSI